MHAARQYFWADYKRDDDADEIVDGMKHVGGYGTRRNDFMMHFMPFVQFCIFMTQPMEHGKYEILEHDADEEVPDDFGNGWHSD